MSNIKIDVRIEDELDKEAVVRNYRTTASGMNELCCLAEKRGCNEK